MPVKLKAKWLQYPDNFGYFFINPCLTETYDESENTQLRSIFWFPWIDPAPHPQNPALRLFIQATPGTIPGIISVAQGVVDYVPGIGKNPLPIPGSVLSISKTRLTIVKHRPAVVNSIAGVVKTSPAVPAGICTELKIWSGTRKLILPIAGQVSTASNLWRELVNKFLQL